MKIILFFRRKFDGKNLSKCSYEIILEDGSYAYLTDFHFLILAGLTTKVNVNQNGLPPNTVVDTFFKNQNLHCPHFVCERYNNLSEGEIKQLWKEKHL